MEEPIYPIDQNYSHSFPVNDLQDHILVGTDCPCHPDIKLYGAEVWVMHHAFDHREREENYRWN